MSQSVYAGLLGLALAVVAAGCDKKNDPRCARVAESSKMAGIAAMEGRFEGEELKSLEAQIEAQTAKVEKQCQEMLADDDSGLWDRWADCMVAARTPEAVLRCKKVK